MGWKVIRNVACILFWVINEEHAALIWQGADRKSREEERKLMKRTFQGLSQTRHMYIVYVGRAMSWSIVSTGLVLQSSENPCNITSAVPSTVIISRRKEFPCFPNKYVYITSDNQIFN